MTHAATGSEAPLPVAVIGAGPVGLAAAAHLLERGLEPIVFESGPAVGAAVREWGHVRMFSPWAFNVDKAARRILDREGWNAPDPAAYPTGADIAERYLEPLARSKALKGRIRTGARVAAVSRHRLDKVPTRGRERAPFELRVDEGGRTRRILARAVIDAGGTWARPNPGGAGGLPADGEAENAARIRYAMPDVLGAERARYAGKRTLVLGGGHSAIGTLLDLVALADEAPGTEMIWATRKANIASAYGGGAADALPERGALGQRLARAVAAGKLKVLAPFQLDAIERDGPTLIARGAKSGQDAGVTIDEIIVATGFRPDLAPLGELRLGLDPALECPTALAPLIDPNLHSCGTVRPHGAAELAHPEADFYIAGMKSYGRAPTFLLATGYEQVRSIAAKLAGDHEAAARVELELPKTGVCKVGGAAAEADSDGAAPAVSACCGPTSPHADAKPAPAKAKSGCGATARG
jgi:thioredoxin reductase